MFLAKNILLCSYGTVVRRRYGVGEIKYKGTFYKAQSDRSIDEGENVKVLKKGDKQGSFYIVEEL